MRPARGHEGGDEQRCRQEERIETGEQSGNEEEGPDDLRPRRDVTEEEREAVLAGHVAGEGGHSRGEVRRDAPPGSSIRTWAIAFDRVFAPVVLFVCFYLSTLYVLTWLRFPYGQWASFLSTAVATVASLRLWDRGQDSVGLAVPPRLAARDFVYGSVFGSVLVGLGALAITLTTDLRHERGNGFPWLELIVVFLPAAVHEELLFRGYPFQKLLRWNRTFTILFAALLFAVLHMRNMNVSWIGLANIFLGGILLGLAYELYGRLWFPIGVHLFWNVMSGPILGHEVSGYDSMRTVLVERGSGPWWLTGGDFGIEGSVWMTVAEVAGIVVLWGRGRRKEERGKRKEVGVND